MRKENTKWKKARHQNRGDRKGEIDRQNRLQMPAPKQ